MSPAPKITLYAGKFLALVKEGRWEYAKLEESDTE